MRTPRGSALVGLAAISAVLLCVLLSWLHPFKASQANVSRATAVRAPSATARLLDELRESVESSVGDTSTASHSASSGLGASDPTAWQEAALALLAASFANEPLIPSWADRRQHEIKAFLSSDRLSRLSLSPPLRTTVQCRSISCQIVMVFDDAMRAQDTTLALYQELATDMPGAQTITVPSQDSTLQVFVYSTAAKRRHHVPLSSPEVEQVH